MAKIDWVEAHSQLYYAKIQLSGVLTYPTLDKVFTGALNPVQIIRMKASLNEAIAALENAVTELEG